jgi:hypothetical protein
MIVHDSCLKFSKKTRIFSDANKALAHPTVRGPPPLNVVRARRLKKVRVVAECVGGGRAGLTGLTGSDWVRLGPTGSDWVRPGPTGSDWVRLGPTGSDWVRPGPTGSDRVRLGPTGSDWVRLVRRVRRDRPGSDRVRLGHTGQINLPCHGTRRG